MVESIASDVDNSDEGDAEGEVGGRDAGKSGSLTVRSIKVEGIIGVWQTRSWYLQPVDLLSVPK